MKLFSYILFFITISTFVLGDSATEVEPSRNLQQAGRGTKFCPMNTSIKCVITGTENDCTSINPQQYGSCGKKTFTLTYKYCNLGDNNVKPLKHNPSGEPGTIAMYRQTWGRPNIPLDILPANTCREETVTEEVDTCRKRIVGQIKFEGWVDGKENVDEHYCFSFKFLEVPFENLPRPISTPAPNATPSHAPNATPSHAPTLDPNIDISLNIICVYKVNGFDHNCKDVTFDSCQSYMVTLEYHVINNSSVDVRLNSLINESSDNIIESAQYIIQAARTRQHLVIKRTSTLEFCKSSGRDIVKSAHAVASPLNGGQHATATAELRIVTSPPAPSPSPVAVSPTAPTTLFCKSELGGIKFSISPTKCSYSDNGFMRRLRRSSGNKKGKKGDQYFKCKGYKPIEFPVSITVYDQYDKYSKSIVNQQTVYSESDTFVLYQGNDAYPNVIVEIYSMSRISKKQTVHIRSSHSKEICTGNLFGSLKVVQLN